MSNNKYEIEVYKNQTIYYDEFLDKFTCDISIEDVAKSTKRNNLSDVRSEIDKFVRDNLNFKPFMAYYSPYSFSSGYVVEVKSIRTDGVLMYCKYGDENGHLSQISVKDRKNLRRYDGDKFKKVNELRSKIAEVQALCNSQIEALLESLEPIDLSYLDLINKS